jgi:secreted PhoX family phosphatase
MTNGAASAVETAANYGELLCLEDEPDNSAFQPHTGRLIVLEDGPVEVLNADGSLRELRGNDIWMCLPDGDDNDVLSDGCIRTASLRDTASEPTGLIFDASGERAFVNLQHRATGQGAVLMITGFKVVK